MFSGPMFQRELRVAARRRRPIVFRTFLAFVLGAVPLLVGVAAVEGDVAWDSVSTPIPGRFQTFAAAVFVATAGLELALLAFVVPALVGGAIAEEREKSTLPWLLLTRLTSAEIVAVKLVARWLPAVEIMLIGLPIVIASAWGAGLLREAWWALAVLLASALFMAALALLASSGQEQGGKARTIASSWILGWLLGPPFLSIVPAASGTLWGDLLLELKALAALVAPSSPIGLVTDPGWFVRRAAFSLGERVALMIGLQSIFGFLALALTATRLTARERNPNWMDPTRGHRPPCSDDPIYWREYELPMRRGGASPLVLRLRYAYILVRALLITCGAFLVNLIALAVPIGIFVAAVHMGSAAFRELWWNGYGPGGPFTARDQFNMVIRAATALLALFQIGGLPPILTGRITMERDKGTWESLLTTPLEGAEILGAKARAALRSLWQSAWLLLPLWALGIAMGVLHPAGVAFAAGDLVVGAWAAIAIAFFLGIRPGTTSVAANRAGLVMLPYLVLHAPLLAFALAPPHAIATFPQWYVGLRGALIATGLVVPVVTGVVAWVLTRRTLDRFDEWVGRPVRSRTTPSDAGPDGISRPAAA